MTLYNLAALRASRASPRRLVQVGFVTRNATRYAVAKPAVLDLLQVQSDTVRDADERASAAAATDHSSGTKARPLSGFIGITSWLASASQHIDAAGLSTCQGRPHWSIILPMADELDGMATFVAVAETRGFRAAGERLGLSHSAVSHSIRRLEERLGATLVQRSTVAAGASCPAIVPSRDQSRSVVISV